MASKSTSSRSLSRVKSALPKSGDLGTIKIEHSIDNVLSAMTKNSYTDAEVLAEIIDNSNSAKRNGWSISICRLKKSTASRSSSLKMTEKASL